MAYYQVYDWFSEKLRTLLRQSKNLSTYKSLKFLLFYGHRSTVRVKKTFQISFHTVQRNGNYRFRHLPFLAAFPFSAVPLRFVPFRSAPFRLFQAHTRIIYTCIEREETERQR